jgi:toxin ParE1/3/4
LTAGPDIPGARARPELGEGLRTLDIARGGRRGRHFVLFRVGEYQGRAAIEVIRLLYDAMGLARHLPPEEM